MLEPFPEADAIVSTGFFKVQTLGMADLPPVERMIGLNKKAINPNRDVFVPTASALRRSLWLQHPELRGNFERLHGHLLIGALYMSQLLRLVNPGLRNKRPAHSSGLNNSSYLVVPEKPRKLLI